MPGIENSQPLTTIAMSLICLMAIIGTVTDVRGGKVYNWLTLPGVLLGIALSVALLGLAGLKLSLLGIAMGVGVWFVMPILGKPLGGGDVKFLAAIGSLMGPVFLLYVMVLAGLWAGVLAVIIALSRRTLVACVRQTGVSLVDRFVVGSQELPRSVVPGLKVPFAAATGLAALTAALILNVGFFALGG